MMKSIVILLVILIVIYLYVYCINKKEDYMVYWSGMPVEPLENIRYYPNYPFWNSRIGQTTNMSYDLRGDPLQIPKYPYMWNYSTLTPIYNRGI